MKAQIRDYEKISLLKCSLGFLIKIYIYIYISALQEMNRFSQDYSNIIHLGPKSIPQMGRHYE